MIVTPQKHVALDIGFLGVSPGDHHNYVRGHIPKSSGIYAIRNIINNKVYIGQAVNLHKRNREHFNSLRQGKHDSIKLQRAWNKYGPDSFIFEILEPIKDRNLLMQEEQKWIDDLKAHSEGYNIQPYACRGCYGMTISPEVRAKTSATMKGRKYEPERVAKVAEALRGRKLSEEHRAKLRGRKLSPEHIAAFVAANTGRHPSEETRAKLRAWQIGKVIPIEQREKIAATLRGRKLPPETCAKMSQKKLSPSHRAALLAAITGRIPTEETRRKISASQIGKIISVETRIRMSLAGKNRAPISEGTRAKLRAKRNSPETRAKLSASGKLAWAARREAA